MEIKKEQFQIKLLGKCLTQKDILMLWSFGMSKDKITRKYANDNKIKSKEALSFVEKTLYEEVRNGKVKTRI